MVKWTCKAARRFPVLLNCVSRTMQDANTLTQHRTVLHARMRLQVSKDAALDHAVDICQVKWNGSGTWLAVATQDGKLSLWRQNLLGSWKLVSTTVCVDPDSYSMID